MLHIQFKILNIKKGKNYTKYHQLFIPIQSRMNSLKLKAHLIECESGKPPDGLRLRTV